MAFGQYLITIVTLFSLTRFVFVL